MPPLGVKEGVAIAVGVSVNGRGKSNFREPGGRLLYSLYILSFGEMRSALHTCFAVRLPRILVSCSKSLIARAKRRHIGLLSCKMIGCISPTGESLDTPTPKAVVAKLSGCLIPTRQRQQPAGDYMCHCSI